MNLIKKYKKLCFPPEATPNEGNEVEQPCLICLSPGGLRMSTSEAFWKDEGACLESHLNSVFLLRHLLEVDKWRLVSLLRTTGLHPGTWFSLCETCSKISLEGLKIHLDDKPRSLSPIREQLKGKLLKSLEEGLFPGGSPGGSNTEIVYRLVRESFAENGGMEDDGSERSSYAEEDENRKSYRRRASLRSRDLSTSFQENRYSEKIDKPFPCPNCVKRYSSKYYLSVHIRTVHESGGRSPKEQGSSKKSSPAVNLATKQSGTPRSRCVNCSKEFKDQHGLGKHLKTVHGFEGAFQCNVCRHHQSPSQAKLFQHFREEHGDVYKENCDHCEATYRTKRNLKDHLQKHLESKVEVVLANGGNKRKREDEVDSVKEEPGKRRRTFASNGRKLDYEDSYEETDDEETAKSSAFREPVQEPAKEKNWCCVM